MRDLFDVRCIAEIVSRFDVVAIQEVRGNLTALQTLWRGARPELGDDHDRRHPRRAGNNERMVVRVRPAPRDARRASPASSSSRSRPGRALDAAGLDRQFARTPYAVSFAAERIAADPRHASRPLRRGDGRVPPSCGRSPPGSRAGRSTSAQWNQNLIALGDFNIDRRGDPLFDAFTSTGIQPGAGSSTTCPRTIFDDPEDAKFYDQIAWFVDEGARARAHARCPRRPGASTSSRCSRAACRRPTLSWKISDHYPLWVEFSVR